MYAVRFLFGERFIAILPSRLTLLLELGGMLKAAHLQLASMPTSERFDADRIASVPTATCLLLFLCLQTEALLRALLLNRDGSTF